MNQRTCISPTCGNPAGPDALLCTPCQGIEPIPQPASVAGYLVGDTNDPFDEFAKNPFGSAKAEPVPDEATEAFMRHLREMYLAAVGQGFTEDQALRMCSDVIRSLIIDAKNRQDGEPS